MLRLDSDLLALMLACAKGRLAEAPPPPSRTRPR
jgi:hypothetical protein